jgi:hypothetical protein
VYGGITLYAGTFQCASTSATVSYSLTDQQLRLDGPTTPYRQRLPAITPTRFSLFRFRSPLLAESLLFSLPVGTEMFHFPTFPPTALCVQAAVTGHDSSWVSPFGNPRITARLPTPRGLSQAPTAFIGSWCQGIRHVPLVACHYKEMFRLMLASTVKFSSCGRNPAPTATACAQVARRSVKGWPREGDATVATDREQSDRSFRTQQRARRLTRSPRRSTPADREY